MSRSPATLPALRPDAPDRAPPRALGPAARRVIQAAAWAARHPREPFAVDAPPAADRVYYRADDGWESPLYHVAAPHGADGAPVVLAHGLMTGPEGFALTTTDSLVHRLHARGHDVYLLAHRGDRGSVAPPGAAAFDFDDIVARDVPAALRLVRARSGAGRVLWVGHALGGQLLVAHLARGGRDDIAAAALLCTPVRFPPARTRARVAGMVTRLLPAGWPLPTRAAHQLLAPFSDRAPGFAAATRDTEGPIARGMLVHASEDLTIGLARQVATWVRAGALCDRHDRVDYVAAMAGTTLPLWVLAADGDTVCPPAAAEPVVAAAAPGAATWTVLGSRWGHLDPLVGRDAPGQVLGPLARWLDQHRDRCWDDLAPR